jgi:proline iminopeptidase
MTVRVQGLQFAVWSSPPVDRATPLLLVNGGLLYDHALLWPALSPLAAGRQVVLYDQRGRGESQPDHPADARIEDDAEDIGAMRRALGIRQWDILGHSWGGGIAMLAAASDTAGTRRLVTVDAVGPTSAWMPALHQNAVERADPSDRTTLMELSVAIKSDDATVQSRYARAVYPAWFADREFASYFVPPEAVSETGSAIVARLRREGYDWRERLRALSLPTLVIHGEEDALPPVVSSQIHALLPHAVVHLVPNAGHMPFWEAPVRFFSVVESFLSTGRIAPS